MAPTLTPDSAISANRQTNEYAILIFDQSPRFDEHRLYNHVYICYKVAKHTIGNWNEYAVLLFIVVRWKELIKCFNCYSCISCGSMPLHSGTYVWNHHFMHESAVFKTKSSYCSYARPEYPGPIRCLGPLRFRCLCSWFRNADQWKPDYRVVTNEKSRN